MEAAASREGILVTAPEVLAMWRAAKFTCNQDLLRCTPAPLAPVSAVIAWELCPAAAAAAAAASSSRLLWLTAHASFPERKHGRSIHDFMLIPLRAAKRNVFSIHAFVTAALKGMLNSSLLAPSANVAVNSSASCRAATLKKKKDRKEERKEIKVPVAPRKPHWQFGMRGLTSRPTCGTSVSS